MVAACRQLREALGIRQEDMARVMGVSRPAIAMLEGRERVGVVRAWAYADMLARQRIVKDAMARATAITEERERAKTATMAPRPAETGLRVIDLGDVDG